MKQSINFNGFERAFDDYDRSEIFSYEGLRGLFDYLEKYEESTGEELELDVIALCCDYSEDSYDDIRSNYSQGDDDILEYLNDNTSVVWYDDNTVLYQQF